MILRKMNAERSRQKLSFVGKVYKLKKVMVILHKKVTVNMHKLTEANLCISLIFAFFVVILHKNRVAI